MRKLLLSTLAAATIVSAGLIASRAAAMAPAAPTAATVAHAQIRMASIVCGSNGCGVVQTKALKRRKLQWLGRMLEDMECTHGIVGARVGGAMRGEALVTNIHRGAGCGKVVVQARKACVFNVAGKSARAAADIEDFVAGLNQRGGTRIIGARRGGR